MWNGSDKISHRAMKYLGTLSSGNPSDYFMAAYERLDELVALIEEDLIRDLADDMSRSTDSMNENICLIANNDVDHRKRDAAVILGNHIMSPKIVKR